MRFDLGQVCNDMLAKCNLISKSIKDEAAEDIKASILTPDDPETRSIVNRAVTEAFGRVKVACQRYLTVGRMVDDNKLEKLVKSITFAKKEITVQDTTDEGYPKFTVDLGGDDGVVTLYQDEYGKYYNIDDDSNVTLAVNIVPQPVMVQKLVDTEVITAMEYEVVPLTLLIENFNLAVTDDLKSSIHKFVVDYVMYRFLQDQHHDKAAEYKELADGEDYTQIVKDLNARDSYTMRKPSFM